MTDWFSTPVICWKRSTFWGYFIKISIIHINGPFFWTRNESAENNPTVDCIVLSEINRRLRRCDAPRRTPSSERRRAAGGGGERRNGPLSLTAAVFIIILGDKGKLRNGWPENFHLLTEYYEYIRHSEWERGNPVCFDCLFHSRLLPKVYIWL